MGKFLKMDLHIHSSHSPDSRASTKDIVAWARKKGLDIIAITDHGTRAGSLEALKMARGIRVLVGQEVKTRQGDLLIYDVGEDLQEGEDIVRTCKKAQSLGGFIIVPHPFDPMRQGAGQSLDRIVKYVHAIEGFNSRCFFSWSNKKAEDFALAKAIPAVASSDAHSPENVGRAYTIMEGKDPFQAIREGRIKMVISKPEKAQLLKKKVQKVFGQ